MRTWTATVPRADRPRKRRRDPGPAQGASLRALHDHDTALALGRELFDRGQHFAAHEAWEARWRVSTDLDERRLLQGLIQVAAGYYKALEQRRAESAARLLARGLAKLEAGAMGPGLVDFCAAVRASLEAVEQGTLMPAQVPRLGTTGAV